jgi:hypothetical protein
MGATGTFCTTPRFLAQYGIRIVISNQSWTIFSFLLFLAAKPPKTTSNMIFA